MTGIVAHAALQLQRAVGSRSFELCAQKVTSKRGCRDCKAVLVGGAVELGFALAPCALLHDDDALRTPSAPRKISSQGKNMSACNYDGLFASFLYTTYAYRPPRAPCLKYIPKLPAMSRIPKPVIDAQAIACHPNHAAFRVGTLHKSPLYFEIMLNIHLPG
jgi:hypothetical protein